MSGANGKHARLRRLSRKLTAFDKLETMLSFYWRQIDPKPDRNAILVRLQSYNILIMGGSRPQNDKLLIAYDFMRPKRHERDSPAFWGREFMEKRGYAGIIIYPRANCWYRNPSLRKFFEKLDQGGWLSAFERRVAYGESMGAAGALWHADSLSADSIILFSPQVCLDDEMYNRGDRRFPGALEMPWDRHELRNHLAALPPSTDIVSFFDSRFDLDRWHIDLLEELAGAKCRSVAIPYVGHSTSKFLAQTRLLSTIIDRATEGYLCSDFLASIPPQRKRYNPYFEHLRVYNSKRRSSQKIWIEDILKRAQNDENVVGDKCVHASHGRWLGRQSEQIIG